MFVKTVIKQGKRIIELDEENKELYKENQELRWDIASLEQYKIETEKLHDNVIRSLLDLQEINTLGISEESKNKHRNMIINNIIKELAADTTY